MTLHNIGRKIKGLATEEQRGREPYKLKGSGQLPAYVVDKPPYKPKITRAPMPVDARFAPGPDMETTFSDTFPGVDPLTRKPWATR